MSRTDTEDIQTVSEAIRYLEELGEKLHTHHVRLSRASWRMYTSRNKPDLSRYQKPFAVILKDKGLRTLVERFRGRGRSRRDKALLNAWETGVLNASVSMNEEHLRIVNSIQARSISISPVFRRRKIARAEIGNILKHETDRSKRKEAYYSANNYHKETAADVLGLIKLRNKLAREAGFRDFPEMHFAATEIDEEELRGLLASLLAETERDHFAFFEKAAADNGLREIRPWDAAFVAGKELSLPDEFFPASRIVESALAVGRSLGFDPEVLRRLKVKVMDLPVGGFCFGIDPPNDVRILLNTRSEHMFFYIFFHEFGHALNSLFLDDGLPYILRTTRSPALVEGLADTIGLLSLDREWLTRTMGVPEDTVETFLSRQRFLTIGRIRSLAVGALFEIELYRNPDRNLDRLKYQLAKKHLLRGDPKLTFWNTNPLFATHPLYGHNYVLSEVIALQIHEYFSRRYGRTLGSKRFAPYMIRNFYRPGATVSWREQVRKATGEKPNPRYLIKHLKGR